MFDATARAGKASLLYPICKVSYAMTFSFPVDTMVSCYLGYRGSIHVAETHAYTLLSSSSIILLHRVVTDYSGRVALIDVSGGLRLVHPTAAGQEGRRSSSMTSSSQFYRVLLNSFSVPGEEEEDDDDDQGGGDFEVVTRRGGRGGGRRSAVSGAVSRPKPSPLPMTDLVFVPRQRGSLFLLLGETNTIMYTSIPQGGDIILGSFVYGSRLVPMHGHKARIRGIDVDSTGSVLSSVDESGTLRVWSLISREGGSKTMAFYPHGPVVGAGEPKVIHMKAHNGPALCVAHGQGKSSSSAYVYYPITNTLPQFISSLTCLLPLHVLIYLIIIIILQH